LVEAFDLPGMGDVNTKTWERRKRHEQFTAPDSIDPINELNE
jgi:pimeloyl-ACP methyl ester carboxylesterase